MLFICTLLYSTFFCNFPEFFSKSSALISLYYDIYIYIYLKMSVCLCITAIAICGHTAARILTKFRMEYLCDTNLILTGLDFFHRARDGRAGGKHRDYVIRHGTAALHVGP